MAVILKETVILKKMKVIIEEESGKSTVINVMISGGVNEKTGVAKLNENKVSINGGTINASVYGAYTEGTRRCCR